MRALFVNENIGGHATVHAHLRRALADVPEVEATFLDVPAPSWARRVVGAQLPGLRSLDLDLQPLRAQLALSSWVRRHLRGMARDYDVLHVYTANAALRSVPLVASMPSVVSTDATNATNAYRLPYRSPTRFTPATVRISRRFEKPVYDAATLVVASTRWVATSLEEDYHQRSDRVRVQPYGIDAPDFGPDAAPGTRAGRLPQVIFVGRQLERKGAVRLIRLHQAHLADVCELVLVTNETPPSGRNVSVVGNVEVGSGRLWEVLREAAVFAFPSAIDQASNAVIEALAAGLPVVALDQGAMPEMVRPGTGLVVPVHDDDALVAALRRLVTEPALRATMGAAARAHFMATYDARVCSRRLLDVMSEALERHSSRLDGQLP